MDEVLTDVTDLLKMYGADNPKIIVMKDPEQGFGFTYDLPTAEAANHAKETGELQPLLKEAAEIYFSEQPRYHS